MFHKSDARSLSINVIRIYIEIKIIITSQLRDKGYANHYYKGVTENL